MLLEPKRNVQVETREQIIVKNDLWICVIRKYGLGGWDSQNSPIFDSKATRKCTKSKSGRYKKYK